MFLPLVPLVGILLYAFVLFDRLLLTEYHQFRDVWEADGRPAGLFWRAPECNRFFSHLARARLSFAWLFRTPNWVSASPALAAQLQRQRWAVLIWNVGLLIWFVFFLRLT
jgi:hypothetical protein